MDIDLPRLIGSFSGLRVVVIGDAILDVYTSGEIRRLCREAPVPIVDVRERTHFPGGAANTAVNVRALGGSVYFVSVVGRDVNGEALLGSLSQRGVDADAIVVDSTRQTLVKHRLLGEGQMLARFDEGSVHAVDRAATEALVKRLDSAFNAADAVIVSDYGYGLMTPFLVRRLAQVQRRVPRPIVLDARSPQIYARVGITAVKPSYEEVLRLLGESHHDGVSRVDKIAAEGDRILKLTGARLAAVTLDRDGALIIERGRTPYRTYARPAAGSRSIGAGDTFVSGLALALAAGADGPEAAELASAAAAVVMGKEGTAVCSAENLIEYVLGGDKRADDMGELRARLTFLRDQGKRIVFTNGCFDILHRGHVTLLNRAKALGDVLVVGVNSDASVRRLKGASRPINALADRLRVLSALSYVDYVVPFEGDTAIDSIEGIRPDIFVKGGDYARTSIPEAALVERLGGVVCILPFVEEHSTTRIIERLRQIGERPSASLG